MTPNIRIRKAVCHCIAEGIKFAVYTLPGKNDDIRFIAEIPGQSVRTSATFTISRWNSTARDNIVIHDTANEVDVLNFRKVSATRHNLPEQTSYDEYIDGVKTIIDILKRRGGKTVISRIIKGHYSEIDNIYDIFGRYSNTLTHIYYTPETGLWLGATPELLLDVSPSGQYSTMALAGTMPVDKPWDNKNIQEQEIVTQFIVSELRHFSSEINYSGPVDVNYGKIRHLCTNINGVFNPTTIISDVLERLSPTPAVAGEPRQTALGEISGIENHDRQCYAGYISISDTTGRQTAFVNLRCAAIDTDSQSFAIYTGSGITKDSVAEDEWSETQAKAKILYELLSKTTLNS